MPTPTPSTLRDPLRTYQFRVALLPPPADAEAIGRTLLGKGRDPVRARPAQGPEPYVAGVKRVSGLNVTIAAHEVREGGNALHRYTNPDGATWDPITLEQGLALNETLERWAFAAVDFLRTGSVNKVEPVKRNLFIDVWDPRFLNAAPVRRYLVFNAWVSRFQAIPQLDAMANEVALLTVELTHEGWRTEASSSLDTEAQGA
jgi:phage tail-like protein